MSRKPCGQRFVNFLLASSRFFSLRTQSSLYSRSEFDRLGTNLAEVLMKVLARWLLFVACSLACSLLTRRPF